MTRPTTSIASTGRGPATDGLTRPRLRRLLENITLRVQMIEPDMAVLDLTGALPYW
ncbi:hypothetical protein [Streptomyces sp. NPDC001450]